MRKAGGGEGGGGGEKERGLEGGGYMLLSLHGKLPIRSGAFVSLVPAQYSPILVQSHPLVVPLLEKIT